LTIREAQVEGELYRFTMNVLERKSYTVEGLRLDKIERQYPIDSGIADIMLPMHPKKPFLVIECKRKAKTAHGVSVFTSFDPMSSRVITQALMYAVQSGAPLFATTNGRIFALFTTPQRGEPFRIDRHGLFVKEIRLSEEVIEEILTLIARWEQGIKVQKTPVDWAFIVRLRSFVNYLSQQLVPIVAEEARTNKAFKTNLERFFNDIAEITYESYARQSAYIIMNKLIFYKILERYYGKLSKLLPIKAATGLNYKRRLTEHFNEVIKITKDFEPIFSTGIYDEVPLPDEEIVLDELNSFIEDMDTYKLEDIGSDVVGFIYEQLLPDEERHNLGQFYTPPQIAELITKWCIREPTDNILDPACGSGTFLVKAYNQLKSMRPLRTANVHKEILGQIFCSDINPFPSHLTAVNLAMRDVKNPTNEMNIVVDDFFNISPNQEIFAPFSTRTIRGEERRKIRIPQIDALIGNPPYTTWKEIPEKTQKAILQQLDKVIYRYNLRAHIRSGIHPGIHMYFVMHGTTFVKEGGRIGMIVSNTWLQSDIGIDFGRFLLDNFKIKAIIDFSSRLFEIPLIATCVILLEKCSDKKERNTNKTVLTYVDKNISVDDVLSLVEKPSLEKLDNIVEVQQGKIPKDRKWIGVFTDSNRLEEAILQNKHFVRVGKLFDSFRGTIEFVSNTSGGVGADSFFYMNKETVDQWNLQPYASKLVTSPRYAKFYSFNHDDWKLLRKKGAKCYLFNCSLSKNNISSSALKYIRWGETECVNNLGVKCSLAKACQSRQGRPPYKGWYDLGGIREASIFTARYSQYIRRFMLMDISLALDDGFIAFSEKKKLRKEQIKAVIAYLNSSFGQFFVELYGQTTGGGMVSLDKLHCEDIPIPDITSVSDATVDRLASYFDELDKMSRSLRRADRYEDIEHLMPIFNKLDNEITKAFKIPSEVVQDVVKVYNYLMERRISRAGKAKPETIVGEEVQRIRVPKRVKASNDNDGRLDDWL
jgi:type I restriction-modification system DNA methylase subunit